MRERDAGKEVHLFLLFEWRTSASVNGRSSKLKAALSLSHLSLWSHVWETDHRRERRVAGKEQDLAVAAAAAEASEKGRYRCVRGSVSTTLSPTFARLIVGR